MLFQIGLMDFFFNLQINTCNGMRCGETFVGPNSPNKPSIWTENWTTHIMEEQILEEQPQIIYQQVIII
ncbi:unnamed protein product [Camellia sinensis]